MFFNVTLYRPSVTVEFDRAFAPFEFDMMSANTLPEEDPKGWRLEATMQTQAEEDVATDTEKANVNTAWTLLDVQTDINFPERHMTKRFRLSPPAGTYPDEHF